MRVMIIQERGRHPENWEFRESLNIARALDRIGHEAVMWGLNYGDVPFNDAQKNCDAILLLENYETGKWVPDLSQVKKLKLFWSIDSHCILAAHQKTCRKQKIDVVLNSTHHYLKDFPDTKNYWFPNAYPDDLIRPNPNAKKLWDIGFCGNMLNRRQWLMELKERYDDGRSGFRLDIMKLGMNMVRAVWSYRIHWNRNISNDINYRTFETLGCGTLLFTNVTDRLTDLFDTERHLVTYKGIGDLFEKIDHYLANPDETATIAAAGHEHAKANHTYINRAYRLVEIIDKNA